MKTQEEGAILSALIYIDGSRDRNILTREELLSIHIKNRDHSPVDKDPAFIEINRREAACFRSMEETLAARSATAPKACLNLEVYINDRGEVVLTPPPPRPPTEGVAFGLKSGVPRPFGLWKGIPKGQLLMLIPDRSIIADEGDSLSVSVVPWPHSDFATYVLYLDKNKELSKVVAVSKLIVTDRFGDSVKSEFGKIQSELEKIYGPDEKTTGYLKTGSVWGGDRDWTMSVWKGDRTLEALWLVNGYPVRLTVGAESSEIGDVKIEFNFIPGEKTGQRKSRDQ